MADFTRHSIDLLTNLRTSMVREHKRQMASLNEAITKLEHTVAADEPRKEKRFINVYVTGPGKNLYKSREYAQHEARIFGVLNFGKYIETIEIEVTIPPIPG